MEKMWWCPHALCPEGGSTRDDTYNSLLPTHLYDCTMVGLWAAKHMVWRAGSQRWAQPITVGSQGYGTLKDRPWDLLSCIFAELLS